MISTEHLSDLFVDVADTLVDDFDVVDFLTSLCEHATLVSGADAVGIVLTDHRGELRFMAASNDAGRDLEMAQLQLGEGPCLDCVRSKEPVIATDLTLTVDSWPRFAPSAIEAGFHSVHAFPMRLRDQAIGALNLFGVHHIDFEPGEARIVQSLADVATIGILQERSIARAEALTEQLQGALNSRIVIEQAKGALARMEGITVDEAFQRLRERARSSRQRLVDVAAIVLASE
jgi:transcriptional regulator with GAF, ATPase, and Fis domain